MKKSLFFAAALVAMVACNKSDSISISNPEEIGFLTMTKNETRGYIPSTSFQEVQNPDTLKTGAKNYNSAVTKIQTDREMIVSAFNKTDGNDYFQNVKFKKSGSTSIWKSTPAMYWPIGKDLQFLTYSSNNITVDSIGRASLRKEPTANWDGAKKVSFNITPYQCYQNDIVYAQAKGNNRGTAPSGSSTSVKGLSVEYYHAQAWLTFNITVKGKDSAYTSNADSARVKVDKIVLENVYNSGVLTFEYDTAATAVKPKATWDFFTQNPSDVEVDDAWNVLGRGENGFLYATGGDEVANQKNGLQLNMLMPAQKHNKFVLYYTMNKQQNSVVLPFKETTPGTFDDVHAYPSNETSLTTDKTQGLDSAVQGQWVMGYHYIYDITIEINEITFAPTVKAWVNVTGFNPGTQAL